MKDPYIWEVQFSLQGFFVIPFSHLLEYWTYFWGRAVDATAYKTLFCKLQDSADTVMIPSPGFLQKEIILRMSSLCRAQNLIKKGALLLFQGQLASIASPNNYVALFRKRAHPDEEGR